MKIGGGNIMNQPIRQHIVPRVYLKNFSIKKKNRFGIYVLEKKNHNIFETNIEKIAVEKDFYTVNSLNDKYFWETYYAKNIEPLMSNTFKEIINKTSPLLLQSDSTILTDELKNELSLIIVFQLLRGIHVRKFEKNIFKREAPKILNMKETFPEDRIKTILQDEDFFKFISMTTCLDPKRISSYAQIIFMKKWVLFKILKGNMHDAEFITSDDPVLIVDNQSLDATPLRNGLLDDSTTIFYPLSSNLLIGLYSPSYLFGKIKEFDKTIVYVDAGDKFIHMVNVKQLEHCYRHIYSNNKKVLEKI